MNNLCQCGCGQPVANNGNRFINHHGTTGRHHTEEEKIKISQSKIGKPSPLKGKQFTEEHKCNISLAKKSKHLHLSEEHKNKISIAKKGRHKSEETKKRMSIAFTGRIHSEETKRKIGLANSKKVWSDEERKILSLAHMGNCMSKKSRLKSSRTHKERLSNKNIRIELSERTKLYWSNLSKKERANRLQKWISSSRIRVSKPQFTLYSYLKEIFPEVKLEHLIKKEDGSLIYLDIADVDNKINYEYDSIRYHFGEIFEDKDNKRDEYLKNIGWTVMRVKQKELKEFIYN